MSVTEVYNRLTIVCECYDHFLRELQSHWAQCETSHNRALRDRAYAYREMLDSLLDLYHDLREVQSLARTCVEVVQLRATPGDDVVLIPTERYQALMMLYGAVKRRVDASQALLSVRKGDELGHELVAEQVRLALDEERMALASLSRQLEGERASCG
ncbi:hypothetical protein Aaci_1089 [Alicyclobacillus acidocaldarius subsp. acidocaldarius DSM 446]|uniref:Uncharacterized protein n=1 Tax=Alicyclobacillus acidocaldarius subsp. acidocaldarius (strain ATCC 27009 / DSM 446 / BCRC 14685 / JCM 5260 / KCTC 1825 / NBRC 15652 / NCIMB 11725 / NRRL B-14509 / 104-IA) TaxID=521098 RepID=C8WVK3_ALIAD|nr:hypothetical protein Aaci_1089 [Alicyclobacillus acidocaldarius subsp. acidocaldarius DSM 446]